MTRKTTMNKNDKVSLMTEEIDPKEAALEMAKAIRKMMEDRDKKAITAKQQLCSRLEVTSDKYRTANGVMNALSVIRDVAGPKSDMTIEEEIGYAKSIATGMAQITKDMAFKADALEPEHMDTLCEDFYNINFSMEDGSALGMMQELMALQLCQNVGPDAEDIMEFCKTADKEIEKARDELRKNCEKSGLNFFEICGEGDNLCESCGNVSCHESGNKTIYQGQSAYDACEKFVE